MIKLFRIYCQIDVIINRDQFKKLHFVKEAFLSLSQFIQHLIVPFNYPALL